MNKLSVIFYVFVLISSGVILTSQVENRISYLEVIKDKENRYSSSIRVAVTITQQEELRPTQERVFFAPKKEAIYEYENT